MVIDAKMTLVAYERYFNAEDDYTREAAFTRAHRLGAQSYSLSA